MKEKLIEEIKDLLKIADEKKVEINPNYLEYFQIEELENIKKTLIKKRENISNTNKSYLDEVYDKTK